MMLARRPLRPAAHLILFLLAACASRPDEASRVTATEPDAARVVPLEYSMEIVSRSADEQEATARAFPLCAADEGVDTSGWRAHEVGAITVMLPAEYEPRAGADDRLALWRGRDDSLVLLTIHEGTGRENTIIAPDGEPSAHTSEPPCRVHTAGRAALVLAGSYLLDGVRYHTGQVDVGIRPGLGFGMAFLSRYPARAAEFLRIVESVEIRG